MMYSRVALVALALFAAVAAQGDRCGNLDLVDASTYQHCLDMGSIKMVYNLNGNELEACMEAEVNGWTSVGFGGTGQDMVVLWYAGGQVQGGDYNGHKKCVPDAQNNVVNGNGAEQNGKTLACFTRPLDTGDTEDDFVVDVEAFIRVPYGAKNGDPQNAATLDDDDHGVMGSLTVKLADPTEPLPGGSLDGGGGGGTISKATVYGLVSVGGLLLVGGTAFMVHKNRQQTEWSMGMSSYRSGPSSYGGGGPQGYYGGGFGSQGGYGSHGSYGSRGSHGSKRSKRSKSSKRSKHSKSSKRSKSSKGSRHRHH
eukprot:TRINITY_DN28929_c0_g1_i1.p1 TRINITY_DN28929_c0_g1~~TRINITY_DN28929_c0_g1_i1.p1  ORF type:complete len:310 (+),score=51.45 TRINITY_DN28929_c0_g1_i1:3-932(+)